MVSEHPRYRNSDAESAEKFHDQQVKQAQEEIYALLRGAAPNNGLLGGNEGFEPFPKRYRFSRGKRRR